MLKKIEEVDIGFSNETSPYIASIEPESRHPEIFNISKDPQVLMEEIFQIHGVQVPPTKVILSRGLSNSYELNIGFFFQHNYQVY